MGFLETITHIDQISAGGPSSKSVIHTELTRCGREEIGLMKTINLRVKSELDCVGGMNASAGLYVLDTIEDLKVSDVVASGRSSSNFAVKIIARKRVSDEYTALECISLAQLNRINTRFSIAKDYAYTYLKEFSYDIQAKGRQTKMRGKQI